VETNPELAPLSLLVQAQLTQKGLVLVERGELNRILQEQELSAAGLASPDALVKVGALLRADGFLLLSLEEAGPPLPVPPSIPGAEGAAEPPVKREELVRIRLSETAHGVRLLDWFVGWDPKKAEEAAAEAVAKVSEVAPKLKLPAGQLFPIGIVDVHRVQLGEEHQWACRAFAAMLSARLSKEPRIVVLEREDLRRLLDEKLLTSGQDAEFWRSGVLIEGYMQRAGKEGVDVKLEAKRAGGDSLPLAPIPVDVQKLADAVDKAAQGIMAAVANVPLTSAWDPAKEAEEFFRQGELLMSHGRWKAALLPLENAFSLAPDNPQYGCQLLYLLTVPGQGSRFYSDLDLAELASRLVPLVRQTPERTQEEVNRLLLLFLVDYLDSSSSVANETVTNMNRGNRMKVAEVYRQWAGTSQTPRWPPGAQLPLLTRLISSTPPEALANTRQAFTKAVMPADQGGDAKSDAERCAACADILDTLSFVTWAPCHLMDEDHTFARGFIAYLGELAEAKDPIVRLTGAGGIIAFSSNMWMFLQFDRPVDFGPYQEKANLIARSVDRTSYAEKALAAFGEIDRSALPEPVQDALIRNVRVSIGCMDGVEKGVAAYERLLGPLIAKGDVEGLVAWGPYWECFSPDLWPSQGEAATKAAGRYVRLLGAAENVLETRADEEKVVACLRHVKQAADHIEDSFRRRVLELKRDPRVIQEEGTAAGLERAHAEYAAIVGAFPSLAAERKPSGFSVRMLLRARDWPQPWNFYEESWLYSRAESEDGRLWIALTDHGDDNRNPTVGLAGFDMKEGSVFALWQNRCGEYRGREPLSGLVIGAQKSYVAIETVGLVELPGSGTKGREFLQTPRILNEKAGLPPGWVTGVAAAGKELWVAYGTAGEEGGLGLYDPQTGHWETVFTSTVRGDQPFRGGSSYQLRELTATPEGLMFLGVAAREEAGLWRLDQATRDLRRLCVFTDYATIVGWGREHWLADDCLLAHLDSDSSKVELLLVSDEGAKRFQGQERTTWVVENTPFVPPTSQAKMNFLTYMFGDIDLSTAAVHGDEIWARYGKSQIIVLRRGKGLDEATIMDNNILEGGKVLQFFETPYGLIAIGEGSVGLIEGSP
jgi:hypothetical protein